MKNLLTAMLAICALATTVGAQGIIKGTVKDATSGETVIGATVTYAPGKGVVTDIDGNFIMDVPAGTYNVVFQYSGYQLFTKEVVVVAGKEVFLSVTLQPNTIREVEVVADIAISRETPVAFSNVSAEKIKEQLGSQDLPMILNTTPGVYATQSGGGDGDARITIRGFNQRNVAVMVDGIPMNDMENGLVFWSNWFGLDNITRSVQVQRGLGASKLAIPSVGGTINIMTSGFDSKRSLVLKQEYGNNMMLRSILSYTSGQLKGGWAITAAGSYKRNDGWVDATWSRMWFYYFKVDKKLGDHMLSLSAFGAPQRHGQRSFAQPIANYSHSLAKELGWNDAQLGLFPEYGPRFNENWGTVGADRENVYKKVLSERTNFFHKPVISLRHSWQVNDNFFWSNIAYASFASGGGTALAPSSSSAQLNTATGNYDFESAINNNQTNPLNTTVVNGQPVQNSTAYLRASINNHSWYGILSTFNYRPTKSFTLSGGLDLRTYRSRKYRTVYDFLGGDVVFAVNTNQNAVGVQIIDDKKDKFTYDFSGLVNWAGAFGLAEYKGGNWSAFINVSGSLTTYQRLDYFLKKDTVTGDYIKSPVRYFPGYTVKGGANWNVSERMNIYVNTGTFSRAPRFSNVFTRTTGVGNEEAINIKNETTYAGEIGYAYSSRKFSGNINTYYTVWNNRPLDFAQTINVNGDDYSYNINGMNARHMGVEFDAAYKVLKNLTLEGMVSIGDWIWTSKDTSYVRDDAGNIITKAYFDAQGVKVGDAAQITAAFSVRYEPIKKLYLKTQFGYFGKNYANFNPVELKGTNAGRQSWQMPDYWLLDVHVGYSFNINKKIFFDVRGSMFNVMDALYITDATDNGFNTFGTNFDATSATVFVGMGRRFVTSLTITY